ncbi:MAG: aldehyde ferredoxin oxidoreductase C-terminal domain-containing protein [Chloroflexota bacterium]
MGAYMKLSGYDAIVIEGAAKDWKYLYLHDGMAELRDARHLLGKDTWKMEDAIKQELGFTEKEMSVFGIGPAGENLVKFAGIFGDRDHVAGHNGTGAVMGAKKLKAFCAVRKGEPVPVKDPEALSRATDALWAAIQAFPMSKRLFDWGTGGDYETGEVRLKVGTLPVKNYTTNVYPESNLMTNQWVREHYKSKLNPCWACRQHHCHLITITEGRHKGLLVEEPEYEMYAAWGPLVGNTDPAEALFLANLLTLLGLEGNEAGFLVSMLIELYEKGVLTKDDTDGLELTWGNAAAIETLLRRIANREGAFADMLAEGTKHAAEELGPAALERGIYAMKGHSPRGHDHRAMWREMFDTAVSDIGTYAAGYLGPPDPDTHSIKDPFSPEDVAANTALAKGRRQFEDCLGTCVFCTRQQLHLLLDVFNAVTGWGFTARDVQGVGIRLTNLYRAFNLRNGIGVDLEQPSPRWASPPVDGPVKGVSVMPHWETMLDRYYQLMGWDRKTGRPLPETLKALGLEDVVPDLWK